MDLADKSLDYLAAIRDVADEAEEKRFRGWSFQNIFEHICANGRRAGDHIDLILNDMAEIDTPPGYTRYPDGTLVESPPELGTEVDHPDHPDHPNYCEACKGRCAVTH
ncbi:MAG: hypothetical protein ACXABN_19085 [Candidatus Thorarchaeota archaeon]|jgi:hypothetical protein